MDNLRADVETHRRSVRPQSVRKSNWFSRRGGRSPNAKRTGPRPAHPQLSQTVWGPDPGKTQPCEKSCVCSEIRGCNVRATRSEGKWTQLCRGGPSKLEMRPPMLGNAFGARPGKNKKLMPRHRLPTLRGAFYFTLEVDADAEVGSTARMQNVCRIVHRPKTDTNLFHRVVGLGRFVVVSSRMQDPILTAGPQCTNIMLWIFCEPSF